MVRNAWARDSRLSRRARGLLVELLSHRDGWTTTIEQLVRNGPEGRDAIHTALRELRDLGYLRLEQARGDRARLGTVEYVIAQPPTAFQEAVDQEAVHPEAENPRPKKTSSKNTTQEKTTLQNEPAPSARGGRHYLAWALWQLEEEGALPPMLDHLDFVNLRDAALSSVEIEEAIRAAKDELYHLAGDPDRLGEAYPDLDAGIKSGEWPQRAEVWS